MTEEDCLSPQHVKKRLEEILHAVRTNQKIDVSETEIRELQHFFNERSKAFLQAEILRMRQRPRIEIRGMGEHMNTRMR